MIWALGQDVVENRQVLLEAIWNKLLAVAVVENPVQLSSCMSLSQNYPNPFNWATAVYLDLPEPTTFSAAIFDMRGREVRIVLKSRRLQAGRHMLRVQLDNVPTGIYFLCVSAGKKILSLKLTYIR